MKFTNQIFIIFLITFIGLCIEKTVPPKSSLETKDDYLSEIWVKKKLIEVDSDLAKQKISHRNSIELLEKGISVYKAKQDTAAIKLYEAAIESYPTGELYYHYGNSLSNLNRLQDSIKAYEISLNLKPKRPELASYNIACSYSRLNNLHEAYYHLANSVDMGYNAFSHVEKDPDMKNLRTELNWKEKIERIILSSKYKEEDLYGVFGLYEPKIRTDYYLCRNKEIILAFGNYPGCEVYTDRGYQRGKWVLKGGKVFININSICEPRILMDENAIEDMKIKYCLGYRKKSVYQDCKEQKYSFAIDEYRIKRAIRDQEFRKLSTEQEPKQCDPNFIPKTLEDLSVK